MTDKETLLDHGITPSGDSHDDGGWLTAESYVAWVSVQAGVLMPDRPFAQPPAFPDEGFLGEEESIAA